MDNLLKKVGIFSLSVITAVGMAGAVFATAPATAHAQSLSSSQIDSIISLLQSFGADQATIDNVEASLMGETPTGDTGSDSGSSMATKCDFTRDLYTGSSGSDVKCLQEYLNDAGYTVADSGVGSPGNETEYFGSLTKQAVTAWQNANKANVLTPVGLSAGTGYWGQSSIDYYNQVAAEATGGDEGDDEDTADTPSSGVEVSSETLSNITVPRNATLVEAGKFTFSSGENTDIDELSFRRTGAGSRTDWDKLYIYDGSMRVGSGRTINTDQMLDFSNLNIDLDDGEAKTLTLRGTASATSNSAGNVHTFRLDSVNFDDSDVEASGLPVMSRQVTLANATVGSLSVSNNDPVDTTVKLGDEDVEIYNTDLQASGEDMDLKSIILEQFGSVNLEDLDGWKVMLDGSEVDADMDVDGDELTIAFDGDGYFIEDGDSIELAVHANMTSEAYIKGGTGDIQLNVDESSNVEATGRDYGYGANITGTFGSPSTTAVTIEASELNFSFKGPQVNDIGLNAEDVVLFETDVTTAADFEFDNLSFEFAVSGSPNSIHLQNLRLKNKDSGEVYAGPDEIASSSGDVNHSFDDIFQLDAGSNTLQVVADVGNNMVNNSEVTVSLLVDASGTSNDLDAENLDTSENVDIANDVIPADKLSGKKQTFTQPDLTIVNSPTPTSQTYVVGRTNTVLGAYVLEASGVSNIDIRQLQTRFSVASGTPASLSGSVSLVKGSVDGTTVDSKSVSTGSGAQTVTFDTSGDLNLDSNSQTTVYVVGDIKSDFETDGTNTATTSITSVTAKDSENNDPLVNSSDIDSFSNVDGTSFTIGSSGSFDLVEFGGNNPSEDKVITPGGDVVFSSYRLRPQNEDLQMRDFVLSIGDSSEASYFNNIKAFFDGSQKGGNKTITNATKTFEDVNVELKKDQDTTVDVKATLVDDFNNLTSGQEVQLVFATSSTSNYDIVGLDSGASVTFPTSSISTSNDGVRTYQISNSYPTFDYTGSDATLSAGKKNLYKFTVTAENDDVYLRDISFEVQVNEGSSSTNGNLRVGSFELLREGNVVGTATTSDSDTDGTIGEAADGGSETATTTISISNVSDYTIGSGNSVTFTLRGDVSGVGADDANSISTSIDNDDEGTTLYANSSASSVTGTTVWGDTYRYFNGAYLDYPTDSQTLSL